MCDLQIFNFHNFKFILSLNFQFGLPMSHLTALFRSFIITTKVQILSLFRVKISLLFYILFFILCCQRFLRIFANPFADCSLPIVPRCIVCSATTSPKWKFIPFISRESKRCDNPYDEQNHLDRQLAD